VATTLIVLVAALWIAGYGPFARNQSSPATLVSSGPTFEQASADVRTLANSTGPGPWSIAFGSGSELAAPLPLNSYNPALGSEIGQTLCAFVAAPRVPWNATVPGFDGSHSSGESPGWVIVATNGTERGIEALVLDGEAQLLGTFGGGACSEYRTPLGAVPPDLPDSPGLIALALGAGGSTFLASNPHANVTMSAPVQGGSSTTWGWVVSFSTCPVYLSAANESVALQIAHDPHFAAFVTPGPGGPTVQNVTSDFGCSAQGG